MREGLSDQFQQIEERIDLPLVVVFAQISHVEADSAQRFAIPFAEREKEAHVSGAEFRFDLARRTEVEQTQAIVLWLTQP